MAEGPREFPHSHTSYALSGFSLSQSSVSCSDNSFVEETPQQSAGDTSVSYCASANLPSQELIIPLASSACDDHEEHSVLARTDI